MGDLTWHSSSSAADKGIGDDAGVHAVGPAHAVAF